MWTSKIRVWASPKPMFAFDIRVTGLHPTILSQMLLWFAKHDWCLGIHFYVKDGNEWIAPQFLYEDKAKLARVQATDLFDLALVV